MKLAFVETLLGFLAYLLVGYLIYLFTEPIIGKYPAILILILIQARIVHYVGVKKDFFSEDEWPQVRLFFLGFPIACGIGGYLSEIFLSQVPTAHRIGLLVAIVFVVYCFKRLNNS